VYNTIRPHQALGYLTPLGFLGQLDTSHLMKKEEVYGR
jgi:transposase InsO family protein